ncbi:MAG: glycosyltransferase involved in cell wall biosynthesis [Bradymonadia bacterium]|jgi:glycosyltransferase involved in cell wall biosynthesis
MRVSLLIPVYNEEENLPRLYDQICAVSERETLEVEMIFVDDGSQDGSLGVLRTLAAKDERIRVVSFRRNFGQTAGLAAAIDHATGDVMIPMDADLQNDPEDIPRLLAKLDEGFDVVSGWRKDRKDTFISRKLPSMIANRLISAWSGVPLHDYGCSLKAYRAEVITGVKLYGEMHRFVPIYASWQGARVTELVVNHRARQFGVSKYGINRTFKVLLDMLTVKFLGDYSTKPIYLFGGMGAVLFAMAVLIVGGVIVEKIFFDAFVHKMSLLLLSSFLATVSIVLVMMGLLAEIIVRTYHEAQSKPIYLVREVLNPPPAAT